MSGVTVDPRLRQAMTDLERLFPGQAVSLTRRGGTGPDGFAVLPNPRRPRLLVPAGNRRAAAAAIRRFSHAAGWEQRLGKVALSGLVRGGVMGLVTGEQLALAGQAEQSAEAPSPGAADNGQPDIRAVLSASLGEPVEVALGVGAVRANSKPVLQVLTRRGTTLAFAKVAVTPLSKSLVQHEVAVLEQLAEHGTRSFSTPRVLDVISWSGLDIVVLSALATPLRRHQRGSSVPVRQMLELAELDGVESSLAGRSTLAGSLRRAAEVSTKTEPELAARFAAVVPLLLERHGDVELQHGRWHGDWGPWNMAWAHDGVLHLWDWERCAPGVPLGLDALHYSLQPMLQRTGATPALDALRPAAQSALRPFAVTGDAAEAVTALYLAQILSRYLHDLETDLGGPLRPVVHTVLTLLEEWHGAPGRAPTVVDLGRREELA